MPTCYYCLGNHSTGQCMALATRKVTSGQEAAGTAVVHATERAGRDITEAIERAGYSALEQTDELMWEVAAGLDGLREGVKELQDFLEWSHSEVVWRMEKQIALLTGIHDMLKNPRATQSNELFKMGIDSFRRGRLSEALKLLKEARELNPGDYRILVTLGHTYARMDNLQDALEAFQAGIAYARSKDYKKWVLLLACRALRSLGGLEEAIACAREAVAVAPSYSPAHYELAGCLGDRLKALGTPQNSTL